MRAGLCTLLNPLEGTISKRHLKALFPVSSQCKEAACLFWNTYTATAFHSTLVAHFVEISIHSTENVLKPN